jgi:hypothetical protein
LLPVSSVKADRPDQQAEQKGQAPAPRFQLLLGEGAEQKDAEGRGEERGHTLARPLPAGEKTLPRRRMLDHERGRAAEFAADGKSLQQARHQHENGRRNADRRVGRNDGHDGGADHHQQDRQHQRRLASMAVGVDADDDRTEGSHQVGDREGAEREHQGDEIAAGREEQLG